MSYTAPDLVKLLQGKWIQQHTEHEHYLLFKGDTYRSKHRKGTFKVERNDDGEFIVDLSEAHHPRVLHVIDQNVITMTYKYHGGVVKSVYKRDRGLLGKLFGSGR